MDTETGFSGGEAQVVGLVEGLRARGHACVVAGPADGALAARGRELGWDWRDFRAASDMDVLAVLRLVRLLRSVGCDLAHLHTGRGAWIGGLAARLAKVPCVVTRRQDKRLAGSPKRRLLYRHLATASVGISPGVTEQLLAAGAPAGRVATIWSAVDPARLQPREAAGAVRERLGVGAGDLLVVSTARLVRRKGLDVLLEALTRLRTSRSVTVALAGDGPERAALEERARAASSPPARRALVLGSVADVGSLLAAADLFVLPSRAEGLGVAALEAMALGRAVVATDVGGLGQAVHDAGRLVPPDDPAALAAAIDRLADDPREAALLGERAALRASRVFGFDVQVERYIALYRRIVAGDPEPGAALGPA
ncbi:glycosyltransferase family 4 protein [Rohdeia mirabilis]|uniref:glycosyltransferase family 4 protein n=1 Tax=Rohdeia mirabilis TaxID=2528008 RepID=UPI003AF375C0